MADFSAIRAGIKTRLDTISGLRNYTNVPEQLQFPATFVVPRTWEYHQAMGSPGYGRVEFEVTILAAPLNRSSYSRAQDALDTYLDDTGASSIKAAIEGDLTLGGTVTTLIVQRVRDYGAVEFADVTYVGAIVDVEVWP